MTAVLLPLSVWTKATFFLKKTAYEIAICDWSSDVCSSDLNVIRSLKTSDSTMIVVTHEIEFARDVADKIIFMADGVIAEEGTPEQVINNPQNPRTQAFLSRFN